MVAFVAAAETEATHIPQGDEYITGYGLTLQWNIIQL